MTGLYKVFCGYGSDGFGSITILIVFPPTSSSHDELKKKEHVSQPFSVWIRVKAFCLLYKSWLHIF